MNQPLRRVRAIIFENQFEIRRARAQDDEPPCLNCSTYLLQAFMTAVKVRRNEKTNSGSATPSQPAS
ncbi:MAG: hypothetical protein DMF69_21485 [Acidobacteria bacterium]|nr:MAG: hypothetical protein DMF69_21485 [Acidobacteriota bacterium]